MEGIGIGNEKMSAFPHYRELCYIIKPIKLYTLLCITQILLSFMKCSKQLLKLRIAKTPSRRK